MQEFAYRATDRLGNVVEGNITARDHAAVILQLQQVGLTPIGVQVAGGEATTRTATAVAPPPNGPRDLTQPVTEMPAAAADLFAYPVDNAPVETMQLSPQDVGLSAFKAAEPTPPTSAQDTTTRMARLEPWERVTPDTTVAMTPAALGGAMAMPMSIGGTAPRYRAQTIRGLEQIPFGANSSRAVSLPERFKEVLIYPIISGVNLKDLAQWYRQLATLIGAGLNINQSLSALEENTKNERLKAVTADGVRQVRAGGYFSDVMAAYPWIFPAMHLEMLRASEHGGLLEDTLKHLGDYVEHELEVRRLIARETLYPKLVLVVLVMLMGYPGIFGGMPAIAALVLGGSGAQYFRDTIGFALMILVPIFATVVMFRLFVFNSSGCRNMYDTVKINLPVVGKIIRNFAVGKFARTYSSLSRAGFSSSSALQIAGDASGNVVISRAGRHAMLKAEQGFLPSQALEESGQLTPVAIDMLRTAEMSGSVEEMMTKVADYHEAEAKSATHTVAMIFSVGVLLIVGVLVGFAVIGAYQGYGAAIKSASSGE